MPRSGIGAHIEAPGALPMALCLVSLACDVGAVLGGGPELATLALYTLAAGVVGGFLALLPDFAPRHVGLADRSVVPAAAAVAAVVLFVVGLWLRVEQAASPAVTLFLSTLAVTLLAGAERTESDLLAEADAAALQRRLGAAYPETARISAR